MFLLLWQNFLKKSGLGHINWVWTKAVLFLKILFFRLFKRLPRIPRAPILASHPAVFTMMQGKLRPLPPHRKGGGCNSVPDGYKPHTYNWTHRSERLGCYGDYADIIVMMVSALPPTLERFTTTGGIEERTPLTNRVKCRWGFSSTGLLKSTSTSEGLFTVMIIPNNRFITVAVNALNNSRLLKDKVIRCDLIPFKYDLYRKVS